MRIIKSIIIAFSMYSRIPMPIFVWDEEDTRHAITFLPLIGAVIGALVYGFIYCSRLLNLPEPAVSILLALIPLLITGGFHVDGFMDVQDARNSYQDKEKKLEIMKDPHIGAFAVIMFVIFGLIWLACLDILLSGANLSGDYRYIHIYAVSFFLVRVVCAITSIMFTKAKKEGMLQMETQGSTSFDRITLFASIAFGAAFCVYLDFWGGIMTVIGIVLFAMHYKRMCEDEFGGITGDTAGFFVVSGEEVILVTMTIKHLLECI